ncbi:MAG: hypothetical protein WCI73_14205, partial [Phycisphaerae bacterium]
MLLERVGDLDPILKRFDAWFHCDVADRPPVTFPPRWRALTRSLPHKSYASPLERALDAEFRLELFAATLPFLDYLADTIPTFTPEIGIGQTALLFGGQIAMN